MLQIVLNTADIVSDTTLREEPRPKYSRADEEGCLHIDLNWD
jgi:hypothetical protein